MEINNKPKNTVVFKISNLSNTVETLYANIWVVAKTENEKKNFDHMSNRKIRKEKIIFLMYFNLKKKILISNYTFWIKI